MATLLQLTTLHLWVQLRKPKSLLTSRVKMPLSSQVLTTWRVLKVVKKLRYLIQVLSLLLIVIILLIQFKRMWQMELRQLLITLWKWITKLLKQTVLDDLFFMLEIKFRLLSLVMTTLENWRNWPWINKVQIKHWSLWTTSLKGTLLNGGVVQ